MPAESRRDPGTPGARSSGVLRRIALVAPLLLTAFSAACLPPKVAPAAPKLDRARTVVLGERLDVAGALADELSLRGYAARPIASTEASRPDLERRITALRAVITALPGHRSNGAGLGSAPLAIARELGVDVIVHARRLPRTAKLEVAIVDGRTGALLWRRAESATDEPGAAATALAAMLPKAPGTQHASEAAPATPEQTS